NVEADVPVSGLTIHVATNGSGAFNISNQKTWVDARITIQQSGTNEAGSPHTFTVTLTKDLGNGTFVAANGATITAVSITGTGAITGGTCTVGGVLAGNTCTVIVSSAATGTGTVNVQADVPVSTVSVHVDTNGHGAFQVSNQKTWVDARITIQQSGTNAAGSPHTFTVTLTTDLGTGTLVAA